MTKYIDKAALVAEIERRMQELRPTNTHKMQAGEKMDRDVLMWLNALTWVKKVIDTLEVKEVEEEPVSNDLEEAAYQFGNCFESHFGLASMSFIKGAKWQKEHILKNDSPPTPRMAD